MSQIPSNTNIGKKAITFNEQNAVSRVLTIVAELESLFKSSYQRSFGPFCAKEFCKKFDSFRRRTETDC